MPCLTLPSPLGIALLRTPCSRGAHPKSDRRTGIGASPRPSRFSPKVCAHHRNALDLAPSMPPTPWTDLGRALFVRACLDGNIGSWNRVTLAVRPGHHETTSLITGICFEMGALKCGLRMRPTSLPQSSYAHLACAWT